jgi:polyisoprenyl-teichoic acid--peptidoglycan teichoic acid transferase
VPGPNKHKRRRRIALGIVAGLVVLLLAVAGGYYLWLTYLVAGANARVDPGVSAALSSPPSSLSTADTGLESGTAAAPSSSSSTSQAPEVPASPGAMDILLLGSDLRAGVPGGRSDTIMLVHVDPAKNFVSMLSLPRDLRVDIPGHGLNKLNTAYAFGGAALAIRTVKELTGININHYMQVDFQAFQKLADSLGGVYVDVDRRYFNNDPSYEPINIQAGYQLLSGHDALEYVRYRHDLNADFGRMLRQQRFLQALKEQMSAQGAGLLLKLPSLASDLLSNTATDLSVKQILSLAYFGTRLGSGNIRQVRLTGSTPTIGGVSYVVASSDAISQAVSNYLTPLTSGSASQATSSSSPSPATGTTGNHTLSAWKSEAATVPFAVEAPDYLPAGYAYFDRAPLAGQTYTINTGGGSQSALRIIYRDQSMDQYLGVSETSWVDAPLASPGTQVQADGITYTVVGTEGKVDHVWWKKDGVLYWISNTLSYLLPESELLKVAESFMPVAKA